MKVILKGLSLTLILALCACVLPGSFNGLKISRNESGGMRVSMNRNIANGTTKLTSILASTLSGHYKNGSSIAIVYPRTDVFPLGTILHQTIGENHTKTFDTSELNNLAHVLRTATFERAMLSGMMNDVERNMLLEPHNIDELSKRLVTPNAANFFVQTSMVTYLQEGRVEWLDKYVPELMVRELLPTPNAEDKAFYAIADKIIWAKKVSYLIRPNHIRKENSKNNLPGIDPELIEIAKQQGVDIKNINGINVITETFEKEKIVAVGFSIFPGMTDYGDNSIKNGTQPTLAEVIYAKSLPGKLTK